MDRGNRSADDSVCAVARSRAPAAAPWRVPTPLRPPCRGLSSPTPQPPSRGSSRIGSCLITAPPSGRRSDSSRASVCAKIHSHALAVRLIAPAVILWLLPCSSHRIVDRPVPQSGLRAMVHPVPAPAAVPWLIRSCAAASLTRLVNHQFVPRYGPVFRPPSPSRGSSRALVRASRAQATAPWSFRSLAFATALWLVWCDVVHSSSTVQPSRGLSSIDSWRILAAVPRHVQRLVLVIGSFHGTVPCSGRRTSAPPHPVRAPAAAAWTRTPSRASGCPLLESPLLKCLRSRLDPPP